MSGRPSDGLVHIRIDVDPCAMPDLIGIKELFAMTAERVGDIRGVRVDVDPTAYEQMQMGFSREDLDRILRDAEKRKRP